jgi:TAT (twin-arginine translocation) pathway signal sequence
LSRRDFLKASAAGIAVLSQGYVSGSAAVPKAEIAVRLTAAPDSSPAMLRLRKSHAQWPVLDFRPLHSSRAAWRTALRLANQSRKFIPRGLCEYGWKQGGGDRESGSGTSDSDFGGGQDGAADFTDGFAGDAQLALVCPSERVGIEHKYEFSTVYFDCTHASGYRGSAGTGTGAWFEQK